MKPSKCEFFKKRITYLGHVVSDQGIETDPKKIQDIQKWPVPVTVHDVRSFLGFTNYYRKFIYKYAQKAKPLNKLISGENVKKKHRKVEWTEECQAAFELLKETCTDTPVLAYANYKKPFRLNTDASERGLGAVLYQLQEDDTNRVIAFASRTLSKTERNYDAHKLEFLSLKWSITERFHCHLYYYSSGFNKVTLQSTHWSIQTLPISGGDSSCSWVFYSCTGPKCGVGVNLVDCNAVGGGHVATSIDQSVRISACGALALEEYKQSASVQPLLCNS